MNSLILQTVFLNTKTLIENAIYKYENHPSVIAIKNQSYWFLSFLSNCHKREHYKTANLDKKKAAQSMDIPTKLVKELGCLFSGFIASDVNKYIN